MSTLNFICFQKAEEIAKIKKQKTHKNLKNISIKLIPLNNINIKEWLFIN